MRHDPGELPLNAETRVMLAGLAEVLPVPFHQLGVERSRLATATLATPSIQDAGTAVHDTEVPGRAGVVRVRVYLPETTAAGPHPVIIHFHGGGWTLGSVEGTDPFCRRLSRLSSAAVVSVNYRLAPENPYPAALHDCLDVLAWVRSASTPFPLHPHRVALAGDSAGGNLAIAASLVLRERGENAPTALAVAYPAVDHIDETAYPSCRQYAHAPILTAADVDWFFTNYLGDPQHNGENWADPYAVPARATNLIGLAPTLIITADCDPLRDCGIAFARRLAGDGVLVRHRNMLGTVHGFCTEVGQLSSADAAVTDMATFLAKALRPSPPNVTSEKVAAAVHLPASPPLSRLTGTTSLGPD